MTSWPGYLSSWVTMDPNYYNHGNELELSNLYTILCGTYGSLSGVGCDTVVTSLKDWAKRKNSAKAAQKKKEEAP